MQPIPHQQETLQSSPESTVPDPDSSRLHSLHLGARVFQNAAAILGGRGLSIALSAVASVLLVRYLGSERLGEFGAIYAYLALYGWLIVFGFEPVLIREISRERDSAANLVHTAVVLSTILSAATIAIALLMAPFAGYGGPLRMLLVLGALELLFTPLRLPAIIFQVDMRQWYLAGINIARQGLWLAFVVVFWLIKAPLFYVIMGRSLTAFVESMLMWVLARRYLAAHRKFLWERAWALMSHSFPIAFTALLSTIYLRIDQVMLHKMATDAILGQYVAAVKISELFELLPFALMSSLAPLLCVAAAQPTQFRSYVDKSFRYSLVVAAGLCVVMSVGARPVIYLLYGKQYSAAAPLLAVLIWSEIAVFFAAVISNALIASNLQKFLPLATAFGAAVNVALNLILIPRYAAMGAAWATLVSYTSAWMIFPLLFGKTRALMGQGLRIVMPTLGVTLIAVGTAFVVPLPSVARTCVGFALFLSGVWMARVIHRSDFTYALEALRQSFRKASPVT